MMMATLTMIMIMDKEGVENTAAFYSGMQSFSLPAKNAIYTFRYAGRFARKSCCPTKINYKEIFQTRNEGGKEEDAVVAKRPLLKEETAER